MFDWLTEVEDLLDDAIANGDPSVLTWVELGKLSTQLDSVLDSLLALLVKCRARLLSDEVAGGARVDVAVASLSDPLC